jgi:hypothetical protein
MSDWNLSSRHHFGRFQVGDRRLTGELVLDGRHSNLRVHSQDYFALDDIIERCIQGDLSDGSKVTLLKCNAPPVPGSRHSEDRTSFFADIFPHHVLLGDSYLDPGPEAVSAISWQLPDVNAVFYDFDAFGSSLHPERFIDSILDARELETGRKIPRGPAPEVHYFAGRREIFSCLVGTATFAANHSYEQNFGGPNGTWLKNRVRLSLNFDEAVGFEQALALSYGISVFLGIVVGRPQSVKDVSVQPARDGTPRYLQVLSSLPVEYQSESGVVTPGPRDALLDGLERPEEMAAILRHWTSSHDDMASARSRFWDSFRKQNYFDADRIIAAANLFDTIPPKFYPKKLEVPSDVQLATDQAKQLFRALPESSERQSILLALKRSSLPTLKSKVKFWAKEIIDRHEKQYPELEFVIDRAVNCRNFYVHGGDPELDYSGGDAIHNLAFLTRTLELCYVLPEFLNAGWSWTGMGYHPFGELTLSYSQDLERLKAAFAAKGRASP